VASPPEDRCPACRGEPEAIELAPEGTVLTYGAGDEAWVALVELAEGARRLVEVPEEPSIGEEIAWGAGAAIEAQD
jgi:uncharacterized OB-fold protein